jgi:hypothetical protein
MVAMLVGASIRWRWQPIAWGVTAETDDLKEPKGFLPSKFKLSDSLAARKVRVPLYGGH